MEDKDGKKTNLGKKNLIHIQYCTNCQSHNWNTHHNEAKYHQTYIKLKNLIEEFFKQQTLVVVGNKVPSYLLPIKQQQNKYYNQTSKKYVLFPNVGSFEVSLNGQLIFSKKKTNTWPNFQTVLNDLSIKIIQKPLPKIQKPKIKVQTLQQQQQQYIQSEEKTTSQQNKTFSNDENLNNNKKLGGKFTLTDHFRTFHQQNFPKVQVDSCHFDSSSTIKQAVVKNKIDFGDIEGLRQALKTPNSTNKNKMNKNNENEILVDLSSIEKQQVPKNQMDSSQLKNLFKKTSAFLNHQLEPIISINTSQKSLSSLIRFQDISKDLKNIEKRFQNIEKNINLKEANGTKNSLQAIDQNLQKDDYRSLSTNKYLQQLQQAISKSRISQKQLVQGGKGSIIREFLINPLQNSQVKATDRYDERYISPSYYQEHQLYKNYKSKKLSQIEAYLKANNEQKNKKLKKIYGQWKVGVNDANYIAYLQNSRKNLFRDSTNSSGENINKKRNKNENENEDSQSSSSSSKSSSYSKEKDQSVKQKSPRKKFVLSRDLKKSKSKNIEQTRKDIKKHSSFIIKHKSVGGLSKNQSKQILNLIKNNKQKNNKISENQTLNQNIYQKKFSSIQRKIPYQKIQNKNSRSLYSRNQQKRVEDTQKQKYKKMQTPYTQTKNTLKKVYSKKEMKFQFPNNKQLQRSFQTPQSDQKNIKQNQQESIFKRRNQQIANHLIQRNKKYFQLEKKSSKNQEEKSLNQTQMQKISSLNKERSKKKSEQVIQKVNGSQESKSKQQSNQKNHNLRNLKVQSNQFSKQIKTLKKDDVSKKEKYSNEQQCHQNEENKIKRQKQPVQKVNQTNQCFKNQNNKKSNQISKNQAEIKLNKTSFELKLNESMKKDQRQNQNHRNQSLKVMQQLQKSRKKQYEGKNSKQSKSQSSYNQKTPIDSLLNSPNMSRHTSIEKQSQIQSHQKSEGFAYQNRQYQKNKKDKYSQITQKDKKTSQDRKNLDIQKCQLSLADEKTQKQFLNKQLQPNKNQNQKINNLIEKQPNKNKSKKQPTQQLQNNIKNNLLHQKSQTQNHQRAISQSTIKKDKQLHKQQKKIQRKSQQSTKIQNKFLKSKTQTIRQKSPKSKEISHNHKQTKQQDRRNIHTHDKVVRSNSKVLEQNNTKNVSKTKKNIRSVSSIQYIKEKELAKSNSQNKVHSFFKVEKQTKRHSDVTRHQKGTNFNYQQNQDEIESNKTNDLIKQSKVSPKLNSIAIQTMESNKLNKYKNYLQGHKSQQKKRSGSQRSSKSKSVQSRNQIVDSVRSSIRSHHESVDSLRKKQVIKDIYAPTRLKVDKRKRNKAQSKIHKHSSFSIQQVNSNNKDVSSSDQEKNKNDNEQQQKINFSNVFEKRNIQIQTKTVDNKGQNTQQQQIIVNQSRQKALILKQLYNMEQQLLDEQRQYEILYEQNKIYQIQKDNYLSNENYLFQEFKNYQHLNFTHYQNETIVLQPIEKVMTQDSQQQQTLKLFNSDSLQIQKLKSYSPYLSRNLVKILHILAAKNQLLIARLFQDYKSQTHFIHKLNHQQKIVHKKVYAIWLCINKIWKLITVDNIVPAKSFISQGKRKLQPILLSHQNNQLWPIILQKCLVKAVGGYDKLFQLSVGQLFSLLTGSNYLSYFINENISKNKNFLRQISENDKKNFIMVCEKYSANLKEQNLKMIQEPKIFYLLSKKLANNGQKEQTLFKIKQVSTSSSTSQEPYYMKYDVFCENFKLCQVLHLRQHHNFCSITLNRGSLSTRSGKFQQESYFNVVQLMFDQQSFGSITVSNDLKSNFKTFLYKLENSDNQIMKIVGQASKNNKKQLFFDCFFQSQKYYLFIQSSNPNSIVTYMGENKPEIKIKQKILTNGLKNKSIEYLPVSSFEEIRSPKNMMGRTSESYFSPSQLQQPFSKKPQSMEDLRQMFIGILLEQRKNN